jgi:hypothetical protein
MAKQISKRKPKRRVKVPDGKVDKRKIRGKFFV